MTQEQAGGLTLEFGIADRLRKAREHIGADQKQFAVLTGISRGTIGNYENPSYQTRKSYVIREWAMATGVNPDWLETGAGSSSTTPGPGGPDGGEKLAKYTARKRGSRSGAMLPEGSALSDLAA